MTAPDPIGFTGEWRQGPGGLRIPVIPQAPTVPEPQARPATAAEQCVPGHRTTYRTTTCADCGCLLVVGESCPACLAWAELDVVLGSWRAAERQNRRAS
jgi:hypothetical protein